MSKNKKPIHLGDLGSMKEALPEVNAYVFCVERKKDPAVFQKFVEITKNHPCARCFTKGCKVRKGRFPA